MLDRDDPRHGTANGYVNYSCRCQRCKDANAKRHREMRQGRLERMKRGTEGPRKHGSFNTYKNWGCKCGPCWEAYKKEYQ